MSADKTGRSLASDARRLDRLAAIVAAAFAREPAFDRPAAEQFYPRLRADLTEAGATDEDFEPLTKLLIRLVLEGDRIDTKKARKAQLLLISTHFAYRDFTVRVENGSVCVDFLPPPIKH